MVVVEPLAISVDETYATRLRPIKASTTAYRLPAEWEQQDATWLIWPGHSRVVPHWHGHVDSLRRFYHTLLQQIGRFERVCLLSDDAMQEVPLSMAGDGRRLELTLIESDDIWLRDTAPTFLIPSPPFQHHSPHAPLRALCGRWQAYGGKYRPFLKDAQVAVRMAAKLQCQIISLPYVLEGGAIESDGRGTLLASRRSIACEKRNGGISLQHLETLIQDHLGISRLIWIDGCLEGDDTDGHVDQLARFVAPGKVLVAHQSDPLDPAYNMLHHLQQHLRSTRDAEGRLLDVIPVHLPSAQFIDGRRLPASHLNFFIGNHAVFMPCFGCQTDGHAVKILESCFPDKTIMPIDCRVLIRGGGALHCITRQQPARPCSSQPGVNKLEHQN